MPCTTGATCKENAGDQAPVARYTLLMPLRKKSTGIYLRDCDRASTQPFSALSTPHIGRANPEIPVIVTNHGLKRCEFCYSEENFFLSQRLTR